MNINGHMETECDMAAAAEKKGGRGPKAYPAEMKEKALEMLNDGVRPAEIADKVGVSYSTILNWRGAAGSKKKKKATKSNKRGKAPTVAKSIPKSAVVEPAKRASSSLAAENATLKLFIMQAKPHLPKNLVEIASQLGIAI